MHTQLYGAPRPTYKDYVVIVVVVVVVVVVAAVVVLVVWTGIA